MFPHEILALSFRQNPEIPFQVFPLRSGAITETRPGRMCPVFALCLSSSHLSGGGGTGIRVQGSGFRVQGSGFRVQGSGFRIQNSGFRVQDSEFVVSGGGGAAGPYRGTSLIQNSAHLGPYSRDMPRALWQFQGEGGLFLMSEGPL